jgi:hypothetical protein
VTTLTLYLISETDGARRFSRLKSGAKAFWVPRTCTPRVTKFSPVEGEYRRCEVDIEDWFIEKMREKQPKERQEELGI